MARAPNEKAAEARKLFLDGMKLVDIARHLELPEGTVRRWKSTYGWDSERSDKKSERSHKKKGAQPGNKNAVGNTSSPPENKKAEKHGFFSKYLPEETFAIIQQIEQKPPLDILWENIQIAYAAIIRAQSIMYVQDREDKSKEIVGESHSRSIRKTEKTTSATESDSYSYQVQQAWDKQANFLKAQSRAQAELRSMIRAYDEMLNKSWELATEEQKARIAALKARVESGADASGQMEELIKGMRNG